MSEPFSHFSGYLKCHRPEAANEIGLLALKCAFPGFLELSPQEVASNNAETLTNLPAAITHVSFQTKPYRRFAGDSMNDRTLPRGSYYTVCRNSSGDDLQTLAQELMAYGDPMRAGEVHVIDRSDLRYCDQDKSQQCLDIFFYSKPWKYNPFCEPFSKITGSKNESVATQGLKVVLPFIVTQVDIDNVIDLRRPSTQAWLVDNFATGDGKFLTRSLLSPESVSFYSMLPELMVADHGGSNITHALGTFLRSIGAQAFIFPSARSDVRCIWQGGVLKDWSGWNMVDYRGAPKVEPGGYIHLGPWEQTMIGPVRIETAPHGDEFYGSFSINGVAESHLARHKQSINRFYKRSFIVHPHGRDIGPVSLDVIREKLTTGAIAPTTEVTLLGDELPVGSMCAADLFPSDSEANE